MVSARTGIRVSGDPLWLYPIFAASLLLFVGIVSVLSLIEGRLLLGPLLTLAASAVFLLCWATFRRTVRISQHTIYISRFGKRAAIPVSDIARVTHTSMLWVHVFAIEFRGSTPFGRFLYLDPVFISTPAYTVLSQLEKTTV